MGQYHIVQLDCVHEINQSIKLPFDFAHAIRITIMYSCSAQLENNLFYDPTFTVVTKIRNTLAPLDPLIPLDEWIENVEHVS